MLTQPISQSTHIRPSWSTFQKPLNQSLIHTPLLTSLRNRTRLKNVNRNRIQTTNKFANQTSSFVMNRHGGHKIPSLYTPPKMMTESMAIDPEPPVWIPPTSLGMFIIEFNLLDKIIIIQLKKQDRHQL